MDAERRPQGGSDEYVGAAGARYRFSSLSRVSDTALACASKPS